MLIKFKIALLAIISLFLLVSCLTPLDGDGSGSSLNNFIQPLNLFPGNKWKLVIRQNNEVYNDSFCVVNYETVNYKGRAVPVYTTSYPALNYFDTDTILYKYWQINNSRLIEYGWEKRLRSIPILKYDSKVYPESLVVADFTNNSGYSTQLHGDGLGIWQSSSTGSITVHYESYNDWHGFSNCNYRLVFGNNQVLQIYGRVRDTYFDGRQY